MSGELKARNLPQGKEEISETTFYFVTFLFVTALDVTTLDVLILVNKILWVEVAPLSPGNMHIYLSVDIPLLEPGVSFLEISVVRITKPRILLTLFSICLKILETNRSEFDNGSMIAFL